MRIKIDKYPVYKYEELSKEVQEKVLDNFRQNNEYYFLNDDLTEYLLELLKNYKITYAEVPKLYYSLSYCQGDGAMFEGKVYWKSYTIDIKQSGMYYHYNSKELDIYSTKTDKQASDKVYAEFNSIFIEISKELEKYGYAYIEDEDSEESIIDIIHANNYEFTESGLIA